MWAGAATVDFPTHTESSGEPLLATLAPEGQPTAGFEWLKRPPCETISLYDSWQLMGRKAELRKAHFDLWQSTREITGTGRPVNAIICPVAPYASVPHGMNVYVHFTML